MSHESFRGSVLPSLALALASVVACSGPPAANDAPGPATTTTFTRTVVEFAPGRPPAVAQVPVTLDEQVARVAQGKPASTSRTVTAPSCYIPDGGVPEGGVAQAPDAGVDIDTSCAGSDLWLFDQTNLTGNELCIRNACPVPIDANLDLSKVGRECTYLPPHGVVCFSSWSGAVRSIYGGNEAGEFFAGNKRESFAVFQREATVSATVQEATWVVLNPPPR
jgi:hypothetical protein